MLFGFYMVLWWCKKWASFVIVERASCVRVVMTDAVGRPTSRYSVAMFSRGGRVLFAVTCVR